jgi:hypothetical protein
MLSQHHLQHFHHKFERPKSMQLCPPISRNAFFGNNDSGGETAIDG